jgi:hypothetical protein
LRGHHGIAGLYRNALNGLFVSAVQAMSCLADTCGGLEANRSSCAKAAAAFPHHWPEPVIQQEAQLQPRSEAILAAPRTAGFGRTGRSVTLCRLAILSQYQLFQAPSTRVRFQEVAGRNRTSEMRSIAEFPLLAFHALKLPVCFGDRASTLLMADDSVPL